ncbi:cytochrome P450 [Phyllosticta citrichinensis]|uniref:Cytochrome P450 n=1 Tax=Phyllosticta citrichinensis TaxID=1130410 RepID=A0ABR1XVU6_9PEZI
MDTLRSIPTFLPGKIDLETYGPREIHVVHVVAFLLPISFLLLVFLQRQKTVKAPLLASELDEGSRKKKFTFQCLELLQDGYERAKAGLSMYRVTTSDGSEEVLLNHKYLKELKELPEDCLNFMEAIRISTVGDYSTITSSSAEHVAHVVKSDLTPSLPKLVPALVEEVDLSIERAFPKCEDWTAVKMNKMMLDIIPQISARIFVGEPLCRDLRWIELSRDYTLEALAASHAIKPWHPWLRPFVYRFLPEIRVLHKTLAEAKEFMTKVAIDRGSNNKKENVMFDWMKARSPAGYETDYKRQAMAQVSLSLAAIHTTSMASTHMLYDLAAHPEIIEELREELEAAMAETGGLNKDTLPKLKKMDSFMKESQRANPPGLTTFKRLVTKDITLKDGTLLPKGVIINVDSSMRYMDSALYEDPEKFDAWRYLRLREQTGSSSHHQFVSSNPESLFWGQGRHACPGRFFANSEIKVVLARLLLKYDLTAVGGLRPKNMVFGTSISPNPEGEVFVKARG